MRKTGLAVRALAGLAAFALAGASAAQDEFKLMKSEKVGELKIDMPEAQVKQAVPGPPARAHEQHWGADGRYHQKWTYAPQGLKLSLVSEKKGGAKTLESIECAARSTLKTLRGIVIGSALAEVQKVYAAEYNKEESKPGVFVAGTIYGGLIFNFKADKVSVMFLGAAAE